MLSDTQKLLDFIGGADADRTRDLLNAIQAGGVDSRLAQQSAHRLLFL